MKKLFRRKGVRWGLGSVGAVLICMWFAAFGWLVQDVRRHKDCVKMAAINVEKNCFSDRIQFVQQTLYYREAVHLVADNLRGGEKNQEVEDIEATGS